MFSFFRSLTCPILAVKTLEVQSDASWSACSLMTLQSNSTGSEKESRRHSVSFSSSVLYTVRITFDSKRRNIPWIIQADWASRMFLHSLLAKYILHQNCPMIILSFQQSLKLDSQVRPVTVLANHKIDLGSNPAFSVLT